MVAYLAYFVTSLGEIREFKLNLRNRIGISSQSMFSLKKALLKKFTLQRVRLYFDGTLVDPIVCKKFEEELKVFAEEVLVSV